jgi:hypothetical protein
LIDFDPEELIRALTAIQALGKRFLVQNPAVSLDDMQRHLRGEKEKFPCVGSHKYFYLDWDLNLWRCEAWSEPPGSVFDLDRIPDCHDHCTACLISCYRDASVLMHAGIAIEDAVVVLAAGRFRQAARLLFRRTVGLSWRAVVAQRHQIARLACPRSPH